MTKNYVHFPEKDLPSWGNSDNKGNSNYTEKPKNHKRCDSPNFSTTWRWNPDSELFTRAKTMSHSFFISQHDAFELWCWRRLLRVPWTTRWSNQSILKEINPEHSLEGLCWSSNTLATWYWVPMHWKRPWCWERLKERGDEDDRGWGGWMASLTWWTWVWVSSGSWWWTGNSGVLQSMG